MKKSRLILVVVALALVVGVSLGISQVLDGTQASFAQLKISNLTCGSCVSNIEEALEPLPGIQSVAVSVATGRGTVGFDPERLDGDRIAEAVATAGYPASVDFVVSAEEHRKLQQEQGALSERFVARIGDRLVTREKFDAEVERNLKADAPASPAILTAVWQQCLQRETLLGAAERSQVVVQDSEVWAKIEDMKKGMPGFEDRITEHFGGMAAYFGRLKADMIINRLLDEQVPSGEAGPAERQLRLNDWYREVSATTPVTIFDAELKGILESKGGCGGSCC